MTYYSKFACTLGLTLLLGACANEPKEPMTLPTPAALNDVSASVTPPTTDTETSTTETPDTTDGQNQTDEFATPDISTIDLFVEYMNTLLNTLNSLHASLTNNIDLQTQTEDATMITSLNVIKDNLFIELKKTNDHIEALPKPDEEVTLLQQYMVEAYTYTLNQLELEYKIALAESDTEEASAREESSQVDFNRITAIENAKAEISRLSNDAYYSK